MANKSIFTIIAIVLFTVATFKAKIDAKPIKLQAMLDQQLINSIKDSSNHNSNNLKAAIDSLDFKKTF